jgi:hypothetical protein
MKMDKRPPRWIGLVLVVLGALALGNGLEMLFAPSWWYQAVPGVPETGPLNAHLVADGGTFNIPIGLGLILATRDPYRNVLVIAIAAGAGVLHSFLHLYSHAAGLLSLDHLATEIFGIYLPAALLVALIPIVLKHGPPSRFSGSGK